jgi:hypothetical protein
MSLKLKEKNEVVPYFHSLMEDNSNVIDELALLTSNIRRKVYGILDFFSHLILKNKILHVFLMLNPRFKSLYIVFSFVGRDQGAIV